MKRASLRSMWAVGAACLLVIGCAVPLPPARMEAPQGYAVLFPSAPESTQGMDGPVEFRIDAMRTTDGARFETAWFRFPQGLNAEEREALMVRVEGGLKGRSTKTVSRQRVAQGKDDWLDVVFDHEDGRRGYHRIFYLSARAMLQVSVVGPKGGAWEKRVAAFFGSLDTRRAGPFEEPEVSASL